VSSVVIRNLDFNTNLLISDHITCYDCCALLNILWKKL
jgi:hypothetical protein